MNVYIDIKSIIAWVIGIVLFFLIAYPIILIDQYKDLKSRDLLVDGCSLWDFIKHRITKKNL